MRNLLILGADTAGTMIAKKLGSPTTTCDRHRDDAPPRPQHPCTLGPVWRRSIFDFYTLEGTEALRHDLGPVDRGRFYDPALLADLTSLRFTEAGHGVLILGPVRIGKTHLATALGHTAIRRRLSVHPVRADKLFTWLRAVRLNNIGSAAPLIGGSRHRIGILVAPWSVQSRYDWQEEVG